MSAGPLNTLAEMQATLGVVNVRTQVLCDTVSEACTALIELSEQAAARGELALSKEAMDAVESIYEKIRAMAVLTGATNAEA